MQKSGFFPRNCFALRVIFPRRIKEPDEVDDRKCFFKSKGFKKVVNFPA
jgi:hypothetical protein